jgi:uroporphyrinogen-III synthase
MISSVFITKEVDDESELSQWCNDNNIRLVSKSFLHFESLTFSELPSGDVYFFTSKRAVSFFLSQHKIPDEVQIACVGQSTANEFLKRGIYVDFIGKSSGNPMIIAKELSNFIGQKSIIFIGALEGSDAIYSQLNSNSKRKYPVYKTIIIPESVNDKFDYYVFTSPSNLKGFLELNSLPTNSNVIAWGKTTEKALKAKGLNPYITLENSSENELISKLSLLEEGQGR